MARADVVCFHNPNEENGYLSNWYEQEFEYNGVSYISMEQYMMHQKAVLFNDHTTAAKIMRKTSMAKIKALGREVQNFDNEVWKKRSMGIVCDGLLAKFRSDKDLLKKLVGTGDTVIAECAVKDTIWGIGLSMHDRRRFDRSSWKGKNQLGECLMKVRGILASEV